MSGVTFDIVSLAGGNFKFATFVHLVAESVDVEFIPIDFQRRRIATRPVVTVRSAVRSGSAVGSTVSSTLIPAQLDLIGISAFVAIENFSLPAAPQNSISFGETLGILAFASEHVVQSLCRLPTAESGHVEVGVQLVLLIGPGSAAMV